MQILLIGPENRHAGLPEKLAAHHLHRHPLGKDVTAADLQGIELVIDAEFDAHPSRLGLYATQPNSFFMLHANRVQLQAVAADLGVRLPLFNVAGLNAWPGCLAAEPWEMSIATENAKELLQEKCTALGVSHLLVADRVGMVTPRVISMIINEAYYTLQEGTASKADIDLGMKLGTNYPKGPFEWAAEIGLSEVRALLEALYADTQDPRYKLCPLLKTESFSQQ
jgi:3-hydroxybutyryl-CoA dehydrogenase